MLLAITRGVMAQQPTDDERESDGRGFKVLRTLHGFTEPNSVLGLAVNEEGTIYGTANFGGPLGGALVGGNPIPALPNGFDTPGTRFRFDRHDGLRLIPAPLPVDGGPGNAAIGLLLDPAGNLVFASAGGGASERGGVFRQAPASAALTTIHSFAGYAPGPAPGDGLRPAGNLVRDAAGNLYGTTLLDGGSTDDLLCLSTAFHGCGMVYKLDGQTGQETVLQRFNFQNGWLGFGVGLDRAGNLYGAAIQGGDPSCKDNADVFASIKGCGVIFRIDRAGSYTIIHSFAHRFVSPFGPPTVAPPGAEVLGDNPTLIVVEEDGTVFGVTEDGGNFGLGVIFKIDRAGGYSVLHHFAGPIDGWNTQSLLLRYGKLYGVNGVGGDIMNCGFGTGCGTVFEVDTRTGKFTVLHTFSKIEEGAGPTAISFDHEHHLVGATIFGGDLADTDPNCAAGCGNLFTLKIRNGDDDDE
jgi:uncharacterized repeat protein (TIGR03803 family)